MYIMMVVNVLLGPTHKFTKCRKTSKLNGCLLFSLLSLSPALCLSFGPIEYIKKKHSIKKHFILPMFLLQIKFAAFALRTICNCKRSEKSVQSDYIG